MAHGAQAVPRSLSRSPRFIAVSTLRLPALTLLAALISLPAAYTVHAEDQPQIDCSAGGASTVEEQYCSEQALDRADAELNTLYKHAVKAAAALDAQLAETDKSLAGTVESLKKAQRIWIQYRDAHCDTVGYEARGGTMLGSLLMDCRKDVTDGRIEELNALIKGFEEE
jgi:uncharacterized protein YecT (DUF1311 family)